MQHPRPANSNTRAYQEPASTTSTRESVPAAESDRARDGRAAPSHIICERCGKRAYASERQAKRAHAKARFRLRLYECEHGAGWHVTHEQVDTRTRPEEMPCKGRTLAVEGE